MSFIVNKHWGDQCPSITKPKVIGYFSLNSDRHYSPDLSQLKYLVPVNKTKVYFNLNKGYEKAIHKSQNANNEHLDNILQWIILHFKSIQTNPESKKWFKPDFICFRGLLTKLWTTPFEMHYGWIICATKFQGSIYLCAFETEKDKQQNANMSERFLRCKSWGFKFEQYLLTDNHNQMPDCTQPVNEAEEFVCVFKTKFSTHNLLYAAEMDGIQTKEELTDPHHLENVKFMELKTSRIIETYNQEKNFLNKILKWWCQSFLVGIEDIICGFRNDNGIVKELKFYKVSDLVEMSKSHWRPAISMNFCDSFLNYVKEIVQEDYNSNIIYKFNWEPNQNIFIEKIEGPSEYSFLPKWYTEKLQEM